MTYETSLNPCLCKNISAVLLFLQSSLHRSSLQMPDEPGSGGLRLGPVSVSPQALGIGFISNLIVFPPSFCIVFFFRKSRPRKPKESRLKAALRKQSAAMAGVQRRPIFVYHLRVRSVTYVCLSVCLSQHTIFLFQANLKAMKEDTLSRHQLQRLTKGHPRAASQVMDGTRKGKATREIWVMW